jgi:hypothetical protein
MMYRFLLVFVVCAAVPLSVSAQDVDTQYLRLQEAYTQKLQDLEQRYEVQQRELLNKFILALVRTEKTYLEEGNLDGVMISRELREQLLENPEVPVPQEHWPETILNMARELERRTTDNRTSGQEELNRLNRILLRTLEPYKVEFTRQGNLEKAIEVRNLQDRLSEALDIEPRQTTPTLRIPTGAANDPNAYNFSFEPAAFRNDRRISRRPVMLELDFNPVDAVQLEESGFFFDGGFLQLDARQLEPLRENARRNQLLIVEFGLTATWHSQGNEELPACLFLWGESFSNPNLALTQEGTRLVLYIKTTTPPPGRLVHRIDLGEVQPEVPMHMLLMYKPNDLTIYQDGVVTQRVRGPLSGRFTVWQEAPATLGYAPETADGPVSTRWYGRLHQLSIKAGQDITRRADDFYDRFEQAIVE